MTPTLLPFSSSAGGEQPVEGRADAQDAGAPQNCKPFYSRPIQIPPLQGTTVTVYAVCTNKTLLLHCSRGFPFDHNFFIMRYDAMLLTAFHLCPNQRSEATNTNQTSSAGIHQDRTLDAHTNTFSGAPLGTAEAFKWGFGEPMLQDATRHKYLEAAQSNGIHRKLSGDQSAADSAFPSQLSTPSSRSLSPTRCTPNPTFLINALHFLSLP